MLGSGLAVTPLSDPGRPIPPQLLCLTPHRVAEKGTREDLSRARDAAGSGPREIGSEGPGSTRVQDDVSWLMRCDSWSRGPAGLTEGSRWTACAWPLVLAQVQRQGPERAEC